MHSRLEFLPRNRATRLSLVAVVALAVIATWLTVPSAVAKAAGTPPPSGTFAMAGGIGGAIDPETGQFSITVPVASVHGNGSAGVDVDLSWQQDRASASVDRSGWGAGWSLGSTFVDVSGLKRVYPASGGTYFLDPTEPSGLKYYKRLDLAFASSAATVSPSCAGGPAASYTYSLTYDDGRVDCFDVNGNLASRLDRFGNRTNLTWQSRANNVWRPTSITDTYGLVTTFDYSTPNQVKVVSPKRSDGVQPVTTIALTTASGVASVTDPAGNKTSFTATSVSQSPKPLLTLITAATGARTAVTYQSPVFEQTLIAVDTLRQTDASNTPISPVQTFSLNPAGNANHNYTGYPNHLGTGGRDALFESRDPNYSYSTSITTGNTATVSTYDALRRLKTKAISVIPASGALPIPAQTQVVEYTTDVAGTGQLPPGFGSPSKVTLTQSATTSASGLKASAPRSTVTSTSYDDHGRVVSATDAVGATTTTVYDDRFGLVAKQATIGADGSEAQVVNVLTSDGRQISTSTTSVGQEGKALSARQTVSYTYDTTPGDGTNGNLRTRTLTWAPGAEPADDEGPDSIVTKFDQTVSVAKGTQQVTTSTAYGTKDAETTTTTLDLSSGLGMTSTDGLGRTTTMAYDAVGRQTSVTTPGGLTTSTTYTPTQTTVTGPDGHVTRTTKDLLGRTVSITDNVSKGAFVADPTTRVVSAMAYSQNGNSVTGTDQAGRTSTTVLDAFGRTVSQADPTGRTHLTAYDPGAANDKVDSTVPEGGSSPSASTVTSYDDANRAISSRTSFPGSTLGTRPGSLLSDPVTSTELDGLGQPSSTTGNDLTIVTDRSGDGGMPTGSTATPAAPDSFPGPAISDTTDYDLTGAATSRTLTQGSQTSKAMAVVYNAAGHVAQSTDPNGRVTSYTYADDGQPLTKTDPSGTVTTSSYDATSGLLAGITVTAPGKPTRTISYTRVFAGKPGAGQIKTVSDGSGTITYGYDADGHRTSVTYPDGTSTSAIYNDKGQLDSTTDVSGAVTSNVYDPNSGTLTSATQRRGTTVLASVVYSYDGLGRMHTVTRGNGAVTTFTYTATGDLLDQSTVNAAGTVIEDHSYTYDSHHNPASRTDTYPPSAAAGVRGIQTWTTTYSYDAYDRLLGSAVYVGALVDGQPQGVPSMATTYTLDVAGNVAGVKTVRRIPGIRPITITQTSANTIDPAGRLTSQQTGSQSTNQTFDDDGRVTKTLAGIVLAYTTDGAPASETMPDGTTTTFKTWPDGSRRSATTTEPGGHTSSVTYHYGTDGTMVNDSTSDPSTGAGSAATASYLVTAGREARTLLPGTATTGQVSGTPAAPITTGQGTGYYLRDRHTSATGMVDSAGTVTASYAYSDYGSVVRPDGSATSAAAADGGRTNPFTYLGAAVKGPVAEAASGLYAFAARTYAPGQTRFLSPDPVDAHNRYQGFRTNPLIYAELGGAISVLDAIIDSVFAVVAFVSIVLTAGAAAAAWGAWTAAWAVGEATAELALNVAANVAGVVANAVGAATSGALAADDVSALATHSQNGFLSTNDRSIISTVNTVAAAAAGVTGVVSSLSAGAVEAATHATAAATAAKVAVNDAALTADGAFEADAVLVEKPVPADQQVAPPVDPQVNGGAPGDAPDNIVGQVPQEPIAGNGGPNQPNGNPQPGLSDADNHEIDQVFGQLQQNLWGAQDALDPLGDEDWLPATVQSDKLVVDENPAVPAAVKAINAAAAGVPQIKQGEQGSPVHTADITNTNGANSLTAVNAPGTGLSTSEYTNTNVLTTAPNPN